MSEATSGAASHVHSRISLRPSGLRYCPGFGRADKSHSALMLAAFTIGHHFSISAV